jgi:hypothetical protein
MRNYAELLAAAKATGTFDAYHGDGATVPWEIADRFSTLAGIGLYEYKAHLDATYPECFRLHDWCYTPYGSLISVTREEADAAMSECIFKHATVQSAIDAEICFLAVRAGGGPWFGQSEVGFDPGLFRTVSGEIWRFNSMPNYKVTVGLERTAGEPKAGFTETWYFTADSDTAARNRVQNYVSERAKCLSSSWQVGKFLRLSRLFDNCKRFKPQRATKYCCVPRTEGKVACTCPTPLQGRLGVGDQGWDGILVEYCTDPVQHTGCQKCESRRRPIVRQFIMRGIPDDWYANGVMKPSVTQRTDIRNFAEGYIKNELRAGSVVCDDACSDTDSAACTTVIFQRFFHVCIKDDRAVKRSTGRPFLLPRGRRSRRRTA